MIGKRVSIKMQNWEKHIQRADLCKKIISKYRPFEGDMLEEIRSFYRVLTTWASNALEGNTLTIGETKVLLEDGITVGGKPLKDTLEACGHADAYDYMFSLMHNTGISKEDILTLHRLFYQKISPSDADSIEAYRSVSQVRSLFCLPRPV